MPGTPTGISPAITLNRRADTPLYRQVYDAYRTAIIEGRLRSGQRVPSTRLLAEELGVSRIPILNAYAQLVAEGYFESRVGAGTVISRSLPDQIIRSQVRHLRLTDVSRRPRQLSRRALSLLPVETGPWQRGWGAFGVSQVAFEQFPFGIWNSLVARQSRNLQAQMLDYGSPMGSKELREAIASYLRTARAVRCEAHQIMIVSGSQQGLEITARALLNPGNRVWMEEPGYRFARSVFASNCCEIVPVPVDDEGLRVGDGIRRCRQARVALVSPSHQYPLGSTMSASRRLQLLEWAERHASWIVEDDYDSEYRYESLPIASLQGLDTNSRVIYIGTFSKVLFPSLRIGYVVIPSDLIDRFVAIRLAMDLSPSSFFQGVLVGFIQQGHFSRHIRRMRLLYNERRKVLLECVHEELGGAAEVTGAQAGTHVSVIMKGASDSQVAMRAAKQNLWLVPLSSSYLGKVRRQGFVLGFGSAATEEIPDAVRKLRVLLGSR